MRTLHIGTHWCWPRCVLKHAYIWPLFINFTQNAGITRMVTASFTVFSKNM